MEKKKKKGQFYMHEQEDKDIQRHSPFTSVVVVLQKRENRVQQNMKELSLTTKDTEAQLVESVKRTKLAMPFLNRPKIGRKERETVGTNHQRYAMHQRYRQTDRQTDNGPYGSPKS